MISSIPVPVTDIAVGDTVCSFGTDRPIATVTLAERTGDKIHYKDDGLTYSVMFDLDVILYVMRKES